MKKLLIFGLGEQAELAHYYFKNESTYDVAGFVVDQHFLSSESPTFQELPVTAFEDVESNYPPEDYDAFIAIGYSKVNQVRLEKYKAMKAKGYRIASFISKKANNYSNEIGENCFILEDNTIQPFVVVGNNVTLWSGNHIGHHTIIEDNCFITSQVVISGGCKVGESTFIGVNSTLRDHIKIGKQNVIGAGCLILQDTADKNVFVEKGTALAKVPSDRLRGI